MAAKKAARKKVAKKTAAKKKAAVKEPVAKKVTGFRAQKQFTFNGVNFEPGDVFIPGEVACSDKRLGQLQTARKVGLDIVTGKAVTMKNFLPASPSSHAALVHAKGEPAAEKVIKRVRIAG